MPTCASRSDPAFATEAAVIGERNGTPRLRRTLGFAAGGVGLVAIVVAIVILVGTGDSAVVGVDRSGLDLDTPGHVEPGDPVDAAPARRVLVVGDSLTVGAAAAGLQDLMDVPLTVKAFGGITMDQGARVLAGTDLSDYDEIVVALGSNNTTDTHDVMVEELESVMGAIGGDLPVVWVNLDDGGSLDVIEMNEVIASAVHDHPNLRVADWNAFISSVDDHESLFKSDGIHYTDAGFRLRARWLAEVLD